MSLRLSGLVAGGVDQALEEVLQRRLQEALRQQQERQHQDQMAVQRETLAAATADRSADNARQTRLLDLAELKRVGDAQTAATERNALSDMAGVLQMPGMSPEAKAQELMGSGLRTGLVDPIRIIEGLTKIPARTPLHPVTVPGPTGPITKGITDAELQAGVETYREPKTPEKAETEWVTREGKAVQIPKGTAIAGDTPYDATAQRNKPTDLATPYQAERAQRTKEAVTALKQKVGVFTTGAGSLLSMLPGTAATNFAAELDTLKASIIQNELAQMRAASKTGGALGQISDRENQLLSASLGALDPRQSPQNISQQLDKIYASIDQWQKAHEGAAPPITDVTLRFNPATGKLEPVKKD